MKNIKKSVVIVTLGLFVAGSMYLTLESAEARANNWKENYCKQGYFQRTNGVESMTEFLGLERSELRELKQNGKSLVEIAAKQGKNQEDLYNFMYNRMNNRIEQGLKDGTLTEEQANTLRTNMPERIKKHIHRTDLKHRNYGKHCEQHQKFKGVQ